AGLYRGIQDFARGLGGDVLSFDGHALDCVGRPGAAVVRRISSGQGWFARRVLALNMAAVQAADIAVAGAELLVAHSLFRAHAPWTRDWAVRHRRPYWVVPHGCLDPAGLARRAVAKRLWLSWHAPGLFGDASAVVFATRREREKADVWIRRRAGMSAGAGGARSVVVHWPVDLPSLSGVDRSREAFRSRYRIPEAAPVLLFVGRLHTTKRPDQVIRAFVAANVTDTHLVVVGMEENLTLADLQAAVPASFVPRIHIIGELRGDALEEAWLAADGYISLSEKENFGYTAADALARGLPVILSSGHDLAYELPGAENGRLACGWLLPDNSLHSAVQAVREWSELVAPAAATPRRLEGMRQAGRNWAADHLSFERFQVALAQLASGSLR
ncbi:MAG: glycosyltransferase, partial [Planctomycetia bacterium]